MSTCKTNPVGSQPCGPAGVATTIGTLAGAGCNIPTTRTIFISDEQYIQLLVDQISGGNPEVRKCIEGAAPFIWQSYCRFNCSKRLQYVQAALRLLDIALGYFACKPDEMDEQMEFVSDYVMRSGFAEDESGHRDEQDSSSKDTDYTGFGTYDMTWNYVNVSLGNSERTYNLTRRGDLAWKITDVIESEDHRRNNITTSLNHSRTESSSLSDGVRQETDEEGAKTFKSKLSSYREDDSVTLVFYTHYVKAGGDALGETGNITMTDKTKRHETGGGGYSLNGNYLETKIDTGNSYGNSNRIYEFHGTLTCPPGGMPPYTQCKQGWWFDRRGSHFEYDNRYEEERSSMDQYTHNGAAQSQYTKHEQERGSKSAHRDADFALTQSRFKEVRPYSQIFDRLHNLKKQLQDELVLLVQIARLATRQFAALPISQTCETPIRQHNNYLTGLSGRYYHRPFDPINPHRQHVGSRNYNYGYHYGYGGGF